MSKYKNQRSWGPIPRYERVLNWRRKDFSFIHVAGPCSVEDEAQISSIAKHVKKNGATHLRGGLFRAGTYPGLVFGWQYGLFDHFKNAAIENKLKTVIECLDYSDSSLEMINSYADVIQIGTRQMQNYTLLRTLAQMNKPIFLKRGLSASIDETLGACEHILSAGDVDITIIERGSVGFLNHVRWDLSISMIPAIKAICEIPVIVDASHGTGRSDLVKPMTLAGLAAGADGMLLEVHPNPEKSLSDKEQAIDFDEYEKIVYRANRLREAL